MKLVKNNKYKNNIAIGLTSLMIMLSGCGAAKNVSEGELLVNRATDMPFYASNLASTQMVESTFTPEETIESTLIPEPEPTPYHLPDEDYVNEEIAKLGLVNDKNEYVAYKYGCLVFEKDGIKKYLPVFLPDKKDKTIVLCDVFSNTELIKFTSNTPGYRGYVSSADIYYAKDLRGFEALNEYFDGITDVVINRLQCPFYYEFDPDHINFEDYSRDMKFEGNDNYYDSADYSYTREEMARMYVKYTPGINRVNIYDLYPELDKPKVLNKK